MIKLAVGVPAYHSVVCSGHIKMWLQAGAAIARAKDRGEVDLIMIADVDVTGIDKARNLLLKAARDLKADWLLMIDADTWVSSGADLLRMILEAPEDAAIIGAPVRVREGNAGSHAGVNLFQYDASTKRYSIAESLSALDYIADPVFLVDAIGAAVMAIRIGLVGDTTFAFRDSVSEDLGFCRDVQTLHNFETKVYVDTRVQTFHVARPRVLVCDSTEEIDRAK